MKKHTHSKQKSSISFGASILILVIVATLLSSCGTVIQTPVSTATQELTFVSPTEVAAEIPTITPTPEPTATATEMPTPTEVAKEKYPIDLEKLHTMPPSYEDVVANPEKYQQSPDFFGDTEEAFEWWYNSLIPAMGDQKELEPNVFANPWTGTEGIFTHNSLPNSIPLLSDYPSFFFIHKNELYLVPILTFEDENSMNNGTFAVILFEHNGQLLGEGLKEIENIDRGDKIIQVSGYLKSREIGMPDPILKFSESSYNWKDIGLYQMGHCLYHIGVGALYTKK